MHSLSKPEVLRCYFDQAQEPHLPAMELRWDGDDPGHAERVWHLPENVVLKRSAPHRFGITVSRLGANSFRVRCLWDELSMSWATLTRGQIMASSLPQVLRALGTDLWYLLEQPVEDASRNAA